MKKILMPFFLIVLISTTAFGQMLTKYRIEAGDDLYNSGQYHEAIEAYEKVLRWDDSRETKRVVSFKIGESYRGVLNYKEAKNWYTTALNLGYDDPVIYLHLSEMNLGLEEFDNAEEYAEKFLTHKPDNERGQKMLESAKYSKEHYDRETRFNVTFEEKLSSEGEEWGISYFKTYVAFHEDPEKYQHQFDIKINLFYNNVFYWMERYDTPKEKIVFSSTRIRDEHGMVLAEDRFSNIYQVMYNKHENSWDTPKEVKGGINSDYYDGFLSYNEENQIGYFMNCGGFEGNRETCDIYKSKYIPQKDVWSEATLFDYNSDKYNIGYPSINNKGNILYFASDNPEGHGGYDLYKVYRKDDGSWGEPKNLGDLINTPFNDAYPFIAGNVLYFSSFGHPGMGGFDIYYSKFDEEGNHSEPQNMGAPINSSADDFGFIINDEYSEGFFSSNRPGGTGNDDIYSFKVLAESITIKGLVTDEITGEPIKNLEFFIKGEDDSFYTINTDSSGMYKLPSVNSDINYEIEAFHEDYEDFNKQILVKDQLLSSQFGVIDDYAFDFHLTPSESLIAERKKTEPPITDEILEDAEPATVKEEKYPETLPDMPMDIMDYDLPTIFFDFAKYTLAPYAKKQLDTVVAFLNSNPDKGIVIHGHTDEVANHLINYYLSQKRAHATVDYLINKGIEKHRLYPKGHGKTNLVVENAQTDHKHQLNRRANFEPKEINELQAYIEEAPKYSFRYLNSLTKDVHFAQGIEFMVQFAATKNPVNPQYYQKIMNELPKIDIIYYYDKDRLHRYLVGSFNHFRSAYNVMHKLRNLGYDTYIVAFNNGKRINVRRAQSMLKEL